MSDDLMREVENSPMGYQSSQEYLQSYGIKPSVQNSPYYQAMMDAFSHADRKMISPYYAAYLGDYNDMPLSYDAAEANPSFHEQIYGAPRQNYSLRNLSPYMLAYMYASNNQPLYCDPTYPEFLMLPQKRFVEKKEVQVEEKKEEKTKSIVKRPFVILLILILAFACLAVPLISSLELISDYINIGEDVQDVKLIFEDFTLDTIQNNISLIALCVIMLLALILVIIAVIALISSKKVDFMVISLLALIFVIFYALYCNIGCLNNINQDFVSNITENIGLLIMSGSSVVAFILSMFAYKKVAIKE